MQKEPFLSGDRESGQFRNLVEKALVKHHQIMATTQNATTSEAASLHLESNIEYITDDLLTEREREIVGYLIRGYSSKACARELQNEKTKQQKREWKQSRRDAPVAYFHGVRLERRL